VEVSFKALAPEMQERYKALAVLLEDMAAPLPILRTLWGVSESGARRISRHFVDRSIAQRVVPTEAGTQPPNDRDSIRLHEPVIPAEAGIQNVSSRDSIRLHDLQLDYVRAQYGKTPADREVLEMIHGAARLSSHVIEKDPMQFASQMLGRLLPYVEGQDGASEQWPKLGQLAKSISKRAPRPWLRPRWPTLHPPGTPLVRTLIGHSVSAVALSGDGRRAVSASFDQTLKVWDLESGRELHTLTGHSSWVTGVAVSGEGRRAVSASFDQTLKVWDLETGRELHTLTGHSGGISGVAMSVDGRRAVSASHDHTLKVWDLETGCELRTLTGHSGVVNSVAVSADGRRCLSASGKTLKVWDLEARPPYGAALRTFSGHSAAVRALAVTWDGRRAVSTSEDKTLKVWDMETGRELRTLTGYSDDVNGAAVSGDGQRATSASADQTLKVWDLETGTVIATFTCDSEALCCAFAGDRKIVAGDASGRVHFLQLEL
jgi:WD40 repeat protein